MSSSQRPMYLPLMALETVCVLAPLRAASSGRHARSEKQLGLVLVEPTGSKEKTKGDWHLAQSEPNLMGKVVVGSVSPVPGLLCS